MTRDNYKFLATDLELAREKGFEYFKKSENWPVKEDEFREFSSFVRNLYSKVINDISDADVFDVALIEMVFVNHIIGIFHYNYVKNFCKNNNIELMSGDDSYHHLNPEWEIVENYYSNLAGSYSRIVSFMRNIAKNIVFNRHLTIGRMIHGFFADSKVVGIGSNDRIKQSYIIKNNLFCDNRDGNTLINKALFLYLKNKNNNPVNQFSKLVSRKVIKPFLCGMCDSKTMFIEGIDFDTIERVWLKRFSDAHKIYKGLFLINTPKVLLVTETGKPYSKIITLAFQRRRCNVFNFHHGNDSALVNQRWGYQSLFGHCDNYIVDTGIIRQRFEELNRNDKTIGRRLTKFISIDSSYYSELRKTVYQNNSDHKKIMIMGYPMNLARYADDSYAFYYYKILLEHKLLSTIKDSGYHVTYKAHPDRLNEVKSIMDDVSDNIIKLPFEDVVEESGILIFTYVHTTTFCYALNLPIPIVLVESPGTPWYQDIRNTLEKRVAIVKTHVSNNEIIVDNDKLIDAIRVSKNRINLHVAKEITG